MFKNTYQSGLLSIFYSCGSNPLAIWDMEVKNGHIKRLTDNEVNSIVLEVVSTNVATTFITCPKRNQSLGIRLPFLVMIVKNLKRYFSFEITVLDDKNMRRRFRISNFQSTTKIKPFCTTMPIGLSGGWNQIQFNLADFTRRAYGSQFIETVRVQVHANVRLRRIYFAERLYTEEELPHDYKLYLPLERKKKLKDEKKDAKDVKDAKKATSVLAQPTTAEAPTPEITAPPVEVKTSKAVVLPAEETAPPVVEEKPPEAEAAAESEAPPAELPAEPETPAEPEAPAPAEEVPAETEPTPAPEEPAASEPVGEEAPTETTEPPPAE